MVFKRRVIESNTWFYFLLAYILSTAFLSIVELAV
jgi:hypothetical protein